MKKLISLFAFFVFVTHTSLLAQWQLTGNGNATNTSVLGTTNSIPLSIVTKNTTRLVIDTNGRVGIGTSTMPNIFSIKGAGSTPAASWVSSGAPLFTGFGEQTVGNADYILSMASTASNARPVFIGRRSKGTLAVPSSVANNDFLMSFLASGYDGNTFQNPAGIDFYVDGPSSAGNVPARISFVTGSNSSTRAERLKIGNTGDITVNNTQLFVQKLTGNIGIGTITPSAKLDVLGNVKIADGTQGSGKVLTSDSTGTASWQTLPAVIETDPKVGNSTINQLAKWNGTALIDGSITDDGTNIGIGTTTPAAKLDVAGNIKITDGTQGLGKVLTSDSNGLASWQNVSSTSETDPKVGSNINDRIPKWNGTTLTDGMITDNGTNVGLGTNVPTASALLHISSSSKGVLFPQVSIDSLKDVTSIANPAHGLIVFNTTQPGARNDMARGYYYYSSFAGSWVRLADNLNDNKWQDGGLLGIQLKNKAQGVEMLDNYTGTSTNWAPKVKILKMVDSALLNFKDNITALVLTGVNRKLKAGWEFRQKTSIVFENNYMLPDGITSASGNNVAISAYTENTLPNQTTQSQGLAFYVTAPPQNTAVNDTPSLSMYRHNVGIGTYVSDINNVTEGRLQITGFSNGDQLSLRHPASINLKWGLYVSSIDSSLNFYSNGSLRANIDRVTGVYSALSDRNLKKNIEPLKPVLPNINKLIPYIYNYTDSKDGDRKAIGFMAQDVEPYFPDLVFDKKDRVTGEPFKMMTYQSFGVIAIKAIQELQQQITAKDETAKALEQKVDMQQQLISNQTELLQKQQAQIDAILQKLNALDKTQQECCTIAQAKTVNQTETLQSVEGAMLEQNIPNPFNENTVIRFKIPASSKSAQLMITDVKGTIIKSIPLTQKGEGNITLRAGTLSQGSYFYSLIVDGKKTDTKQMQMIK